MKSQRKGRDFELKFAKRLREAGFPTAKRMPRSGSIPDLKSDLHVPELPFHIECKKQEAWSPHQYMKQAESGAREHEMPVVVMSKNRLPDPYVMMKATDWIQLVKLAQETGNLVGQYGYTKSKQVRKG